LIVATEVLLLFLIPAIQGMRFVLVMRYGRLIGIITKKDLLTHITTMNSCNDNVFASLSSQDHSFMA
jgi:hypothetical protein